MKDGFLVVSRHNCKEAVIRAFVVWSVCLPLAAIDIGFPHLYSTGKNHLLAFGDLSRDIYFWPLVFGDLSCDTSLGAPDD